MLNVFKRFTILMSGVFREKMGGHQEHLATQQTPFNKLHYFLKKGHYNISL